MAFIDETKIYVKAGDGGDGCMSFRREKYVAKGGPNGGDGGKGGDVIIRAKKGIFSLIDFQYRSHFKAERGEHGRGKEMHGRNGNDFIIDVPVGSVIKNAESGEILADLNSDTAVFCVAHAGEGGLGNPHFASGTNRSPRIASPGKAGEEYWLRIELKLLADVGLVGLPNAGKSTLLSKLTAARPKIGDYPFTTLEPQLGVMQYKYYEPCVIADIPGIIAGAHSGIGLGLKFLKHIERTRVLLHVLDAANEEVLSHFETVVQELSFYKEELADRKQLVVLNKKDLLDNKAVKKLKKQFSTFGIRSILISAETGDGIEELKEIIVEVLNDPDLQMRER